MPATATAESIDLTPTWGEVGLLFTRLAESGERKACRGMRSEVAKMAAAAEALKQITSTLTDEQQGRVSKIITRELGKFAY